MKTAFLKILIICPFFLIGLLAVPQKVFSQAPPTVWEATSSSPLPDEADDIAFYSDITGDYVYIVGRANWGANTGYRTVKYKDNGAAAQWEWTENKSMPGDSVDPPNFHSIAVDSAGNVYVTGTGFLLFNLLQTVSYDSLGNERWSKVDLLPSGYANGIAVSSDYVYVTGYYYADRPGVADDNDDFFTIRHETSDGDLDASWIRTYNSSVVPADDNNDYSMSVAADSGGNIYVAGYSDLIAGTEFLIIRYGSDGTTTIFTSQPLWYSRAYNIAVDSSDNFYITGDVSDTLPVNKKRFKTIKYHYNNALNNASLVWESEYNDPTDSVQDTSYGVAVNPLTGSVYVTGLSFAGALIWRTIKYDSLGNEVWNKIESGAINYFSKSVAVNPLTGAVYAAGDTNIGGRRYRIAKYYSLSEIPFNFSLSNAGNVSVTAGDSGSTTINVNLISGATQVVTLSIASITPAEATISASFSPGPTCSPNCSAILNIGTIAATPANNYQIIVSGTNGYLAATTSFQLTVNPADTSPPTTIISATSPPGGAAYNFSPNIATDTVQITLSCSDAGSGCASTQYCAGAGCVPGAAYLGPFNITSEGTTILRYRSIDNVGNVETTQEKSIIIDTIAPTLTISRDPAGIIYSSAPITINSTATDANGVQNHKIEYRINGGGWQIAQWPTGGPHSTTTGPFPAGTLIEYYAAAVDNAGNSTSTSINSVTVANRPPEEPVLLPVISGDYCFVPPIPITFSWNFFDHDGDSQSAYQVQTATNTYPNFTSTTTDSGKVTLPSGASTSTVPYPLSYSTHYIWRVKVWDDSGLPNDESSWATDTVGFVTDHAYPSIDFTWSPLMPAAGQIVNFTDNSTCYDDVPAGSPCVSVVNGGDDSFFWEFQNGNPATSMTENPTTTFVSTGSKTATSTVTDLDGFTCSGQKTINVPFRLPNWQEIPPF